MNPVLFDHMTNLAGTALTAVTAGYACLAAYAALARREARTARLGRGRGTAAVPVTVLKPLCGDEPGLYENLRSFCLQSYPRFQLLCGLREGSDPAFEVVRRLQAEFPAVELDLVIDPRVHGTNPKVSNLINLLPHARHRWLVIADSDIGVDPHYLDRVTAPLAQPDIGLVTCLYRGVARAGRWSRLGAQFIDEWFVPSVRVSHCLGSVRLAFGATLALRRETLIAAGGFEAVRNLLADDYWLGEFIRRQGFRTVLSEMVVTTDVAERSLAAVWAHEVRWMRTVRSVAPAGFAVLFITFTVPMLLLGWGLARTPAAGELVLLGLLARSVLHFRESKGQGWRARLGGLGLAPLRDTLLGLEWAAAWGRSWVRWREQDFYLWWERRDAGPPMVSERTRLG